MDAGLMQIAQTYGIPTAFAVALMIVVKYLYKDQQKMIAEHKAESLAREVKLTDLVGKVTDTNQVLADSVKGIAEGMFEVKSGIKEINTRLDKIEDSVHSPLYVKGA